MQLNTITKKDLEKIPSLLKIFKILSFITYFILMNNKMLAGVSLIDLVTRLMNIF